MTHRYGLSGDIVRPTWKGELDSPVYYGTGTEDPRPGIGYKFRGVDVPVLTWTDGMSDASGVWRGDIQITANHPGWYRVAFRVLDQLSEQIDLFATNSTVGVATIKIVTQPAAAQDVGMCDGATLGSCGAFLGKAVRQRLVSASNMTSFCQQTWEQVPCATEPPSGKQRNSTVAELCPSMCQLDVPDPQCDVEVCAGFPIAKQPAVR